MPKIIFQPLMIANPRDTWRGTFFLDKMVIACLPGIANPRNAWRVQCLMFKVTPVFKVVTPLIRLHLLCRGNCRSWWNC